MPSGQRWQAQGTHHAARRRPPPPLVGHADEQVSKITKARRSNALLRQRAGIVLVDIKRSEAPTAVVAQNRHGTDYSSPRRTLDHAHAFAATADIVGGRRERPKCRAAWAPAAPPAVLPGAYVTWPFTMPRLVISAFSAG